MSSYYEKNKEKIKEKSRIKYLEKREQKIASSRAYYLKNKEDINRKRRQFEDSPRVDALPGETNEQRLKRMARARNARYKLKNAEKVKESKTKWAHNNPEYREKYYQENKDKILEKTSLYRKSHPETVRLHNGSRKKAIKQATPKWADKEKIKEIYRTAVELEATTGLKYHVDHIIPLKGKDICGLHVHNNLRVIPEQENLKKKNKFDPTIENHDICPS